MKRGISILIGILLLSSALMPTVLSDNTGTVTVTMTPNAIADIALNRTAWDPTAKIGEHEATASNWCNLDNNGTVGVNITVRATNSTQWNLSSMPGFNQFNMSISFDGANWTLLTLSPQNIINNLEYDESQNFGLQIYLPTSTSWNASQTMQIVFSATPA